MEPIIDSPFSDGKATLKKEQKTQEFRKEQFEITQFYYQCEDTGEEFTSDEVDQVNVNQVYNQYREKHGVPFPDEIRKIREKYGVPANKMSIILGFGINSYRLYEQGDIPSVPNGRVILAANDPEDFLRNLEWSKNLISKKDYDKYKKKTEGLLKISEEEKHERYYVDKKIFTYNRPNEYNGYRKPDLNITAQMITYFSNNISNQKVYKTTLNKLLFYADFQHFKETGYSISGNCYRAVTYGPVPLNFDKLYEKLADDEKIKKEDVAFNDGKNYGTAFSGNIEFNPQYFSKKELATMQKVMEQLGNLSSKEIVHKSHKETAWKECEYNHEEISYQKYGFDLKEI